MNTVPGDRLFSSLRCISFDAFCRMDALMSSVGASVRATSLAAAHYFGASLQDFQVGRIVLEVNQSAATHGIKSPV